MVRRCCTFAWRLRGKHLEQDCEVNTAPIRFNREDNIVCQVRRRILWVTLELEIYTVKIHQSSLYPPVSHLQSLNMPCPALNFPSTNYSTQVVLDFTLKLKKSLLIMTWYDPAFGGRLQSFQPLSALEPSWMVTVFCQLSFP